MRCTSCSTVATQRPTARSSATYSDGRTSRTWVPNPGWLIFKTPPTELGIHPTDGPPAAEVSLMCDDINATVATLAEHGVPMTDVDNRGYGIAVDVTLPGGGTIQLYEPRHEIAHNL